MDIKFNAQYNPDKQCISIHGDGQAEIKFTTDATQLAQVLSSLAQFKECLFEVTLRKADGKGKEKNRKTVKAQYDFSKTSK